MTQQKPIPLAVIDGETLMDARLPKRSFCIETLLPEGISMLGGAPKIGKSWMVLDIGVRVAKGEPIWSLPTKHGTVLYLALEDSLARIQERLCKLTDDVPGNLFFAIAAGTLADDLCFQIEQFISEHRDTVLVIIDTSYANDCDEVRKLKALADKMRISLLLVHHLRKQGDSDPLNKLSGTTGISGAMDAVFILDVSKRHARGATLFCTGRDIESRELELNMSRDTCTWELISDMLDKPELTGYHRRTILRYVQRKYIYAVNIMGKYYISKHSIINYLATDKAFKNTQKSEWHEQVIFTLIP